MPETSGFQIRWADAARRGNPTSFDPERHGSELIKNLAQAYEGLYVARVDGPRRLSVASLGGLSCFRGAIQERCGAVAKVAECSRMNSLATRKLS